MARNVRLSFFCQALWTVWCLSAANTIGTPSIPFLGTISSNTEFSSSSSQRSSTHAPSSGITASNHNTSTRLQSDSSSLSVSSSSSSIQCLKRPSTLESTTTSISSSLLSSIGASSTSFHTSSHAHNTSYSSDSSFNTTQASSSTAYTRSSSLGQSVSSIASEDECWNPESPYAAQEPQTSIDDHVTTKSDQGQPKDPPAFPTIASYRPPDEPAPHPTVPSNPDLPENSPYPPNPPIQAPTPRIDPPTIPNSPQIQTQLEPLAPAQVQQPQNNANNPNNPIFLLPPTQIVHQGPGPLIPPTLTPIPQQKISTKSTSSSLIEPGNNLHPDPPQILPTTKTIQAQKLSSSILPNLVPKQGSSLQSSSIARPGSISSKAQAIAGNTATGKSFQNPVFLNTVSLLSSSSTSLNSPNGSSLPPGMPLNSGKSKLSSQSSISTRTQLSPVVLNTGHGVEPSGNQLSRKSSSTTNQIPSNPVVMNTGNGVPSSPNQLSSKLASVALNKPSGSSPSSKTPSSPLVLNTATGVKYSASQLSSKLSSTTTQIPSNPVVMNTGNGVPSSPNQLSSKLASVAFNKPSGSSPFSKTPSIPLVLNTATGVKLSANQLSSKSTSTALKIAKGSSSSSQTPLNPLILNTATGVKLSAIQLSSKSTFTALNIAREISSSSKTPSSPLVLNTVTDVKLSAIQLSSKSSSTTLSIAKGSLSSSKIISNPIVLNTGNGIKSFASQLSGKSTSTALNIAKESSFSSKIVSSPIVLSTGNGIKSSASQLSPIVLNTGNGVKSSASQLLSKSSSLTLQNTQIGGPPSPSTIIPITTTITSTIYVSTGRLGQSGPGGNTQSSSNRGASPDLSSRRSSALNVVVQSPASSRSSSSVPGFLPGSGKGTTSQTQSRPASSAKSSTRSFPRSTISNIPVQDSDSFYRSSSVLMLATSPNKVVGAHTQSSSASSAMSSQQSSALNVAVQSPVSSHSSNVVPRLAILSDKKTTTRTQSSPTSSNRSSTRSSPRSATLNIPVQNSDSSHKSDSILVLATGSSKATGAHTQSSSAYSTVSSQQSSASNVAVQSTVSSYSPNAVPRLATSSGKGNTAQTQSNPILSSPKSIPTTSSKPITVPNAVNNTISSLGEVRGSSSIQGSSPLSTMSNHITMSSLETGSPCSDILSNQQGSPKSIVLLPRSFTGTSPLNTVSNHITMSSLETGSPSSDILSNQQGSPKSIVLLPRSFTGTSPLNTVPNHITTSSLETGSPNSDILSNQQGSPKSIVLSSRSSTGTSPLSTVPNHVTTSSVGTGLFKANSPSSDILSNQQGSPKSIVSSLRSSTGTSAYFPAFSLSLPPSIDTESNFPSSAEVKTNIPGTPAISPYFPALSLSLPASINIESNFPSSAEVKTNIPGTPAIIVSSPRKSGFVSQPTSRQSTLSTSPFAELPIISANKSISPAPISSVAGGSGNPEAFTSPMNTPTSQVGSVQQFQDTPTTTSQSRNNILVSPLKQTSGPTNSNAQAPTPTSIASKSSIAQPISIPQNPGPLSSNSLSIKWANSSRATPVPAGTTSLSLLLASQSPQSPSSGLAGGAPLSPPPSPGAQSRSAETGGESVRLISISLSPPLFPSTQLESAETGGKSVRLTSISLSPPPSPSTQLESAKTNGKSVRLTSISASPPPEMPQASAPSTFVTSPGIYVNISGVISLLSSPVVKNSLSASSPAFTSPESPSPQTAPNAGSGSLSRSLSRVTTIVSNGMFQSLSGDKSLTNTQYNGGSPALISDKESFVPSSQNGFHGSPTISPSKVLLQSIITFETLTIANSSQPPLSLSPFNVLSSPVSQTGSLASRNFANSDKPRSASANSDMLTPTSIAHLSQGLSAAQSSTTLQRSYKRFMNTSRPAFMTSSPILSSAIRSYDLSETQFQASTSLLELVSTYQQQHMTSGQVNSPSTRFVENTAPSLILSFSIIETQGQRLATEGSQQAVTSTNSVQTVMTEVLLPPNTSASRLASTSTLQSKYTVFNGELSLLLNPKLRTTDSQAEVLSTRNYELLSISSGEEARITILSVFTSGIQKRASSGSNIGSEYVASQYVTTSIIPSLPSAQTQEKLLVTSTLSEIPATYSNLARSVTDQERGHTSILNSISPVVSVDTPATLSMATLPRPSVGPQDRSTTTFVDIEGTLLSVSASNFQSEVPQMSGSKSLVQGTLNNLHPSFSVSLLSERSAESAHTNSQSGSGAMITSIPSAITAKETHSLTVMSPFEVVSASEYSSTEEANFAVSNLAHTRSSLANSEYVQFTTMSAAIQPSNEHATVLLGASIVSYYTENLSISSARHTESPMETVNSKKSTTSSASQRLQDQASDTETLFAASALILHSVFYPESLSMLPVSDAKPIQTMSSGNTMYSSASHQILSQASVIKTLAAASAPTLQFSSIHFRTHVISIVSNSLTEGVTSVTPVTSIGTPGAGLSELPISTSLVTAGSSLENLSLIPSESHSQETLEATTAVNTASTLSQNLQQLQNPRSATVSDEQTLKTPLLTNQNQPTISQAVVSVPSRSMTQITITYVNCAETATKSLIAGIPTTSLTILGMVTEEIPVATVSLPSVMARDNSMSPGSSLLFNTDSPSNSVSSSNPGALTESEAMNTLSPSIQAPSVIAAATSTQKLNLILNPTYQRALSVSSPAIPFSSIQAPSVIAAATSTQKLNLMLNPTYQRALSVSSPAIPFSSIQAPSALAAATSTQKLNLILNPTYQRALSVSSPAILVENMSNSRNQHTYSLETNSPSAIFNSLNTTQTASAVVQSSEFATSMASASLIARSSAMSKFTDAMLLNPKIPATPTSTLLMKSKQMTSADVTPISYMTASQSSTSSTSGTITATFWDCGPPSQTGAIHTFTQGQQNTNTTNAFLGVGISVTSLSEQSKISREAIQVETRSGTGTYSEKLSSNTISFSAVYTVSMGSMPTHTRTSRISHPFKNEMKTATTVTNSGASVTINSKEMSTTALLLSATGPSSLGLETRESAMSSVAQSLVSSIGTASAATHETTMLNLVSSKLSSWLSIETEAKSTSSKMQSMTAGHSTVQISYSSSLSTQQAASSSVVSNSSRTLYSSSYWDCGATTKVPAAETTTTRASVLPRMISGVPSRQSIVLTSEAPRDLASSNFVGSISGGTANPSRQSTVLTVPISIQTTTPTEGMRSGTGPSSAIFVYTSLTPSLSTFSNVSETIQASYKSDMSTSLESVQAASSNNGGRTSSLHETSLTSIQQSQMTHSSMSEISKMLYQSTLSSVFVSGRRESSSISETSSSSSKIVLSTGIEPSQTEHSSTSGISAISYLTILSSSIIPSQIDSSSISKTSSTSSQTILTTTLEPNQTINSSTSKISTISYQSTPSSILVSSQTESSSISSTSSSLYQTILTTRLKPNQTTHSRASKIWTISSQGAVSSILMSSQTQSSSISSTSSSLYQTFSSTNREPSSTISSNVSASMSSTSQMIYSSSYWDCGSASQTAASNLIPTGASMITANTSPLQTQNHQASSMISPSYQTTHLTSLTPRQTQSPSILMTQSLSSQTTSLTPTQAFSSTASTKSSSRVLFSSSYWDCGLSTPTGIDHGTASTTSGGGILRTVLWECLSTPKSGL